MNFFKLFSQFDSPSRGARKCNNCLGFVNFFNGGRRAPPPPLPPKKEMSDRKRKSHKKT